MEITNIAPIEKWKQLAEDIYTLFGFNGVVLDKNNTPVTSSTKWANKICPEIKGGDNRILCGSAQERLSKKAEEMKGPAIDECDIGFIKFVVPIFVNDKFCGTVSGCGSLSRDSEADAFYIGKLLRKDEKKTKSLLTNLQRISKDKIAEAVRYVHKKVKEILNENPFNS